MAGVKNVVLITERGDLLAFCASDRLEPRRSVSLGYRRISHDPAAIQRMFIDRLSGSASPRSE
jgi:hypothetical protein